MVSCGEIASHEPACPGHGSFWRRLFPRPVLTGDNRFVTIQWNVQCAHFVLYSGITQYGDENASHRLWCVKMSLIFACDELNVRDCVGVTVVSCKHETRIPLRSICYCVGILSLEYRYRRRPSI
jgi:hypothetical protein